jgi:putative FmdB family regulatory protein
MLFARDTKAKSRARRKPMPTYAYRCKRCTKSFEVVLTVAERAAAKVACPTCGGGEEGCVPDLWRWRGHAPDGDLFRKTSRKS